MAPNDTSKKPGIMSRVAQAVQTVISGVTSATWMGPMQPLKPMAPPEVKGRAFDYPIAWNLQYVPRSTEPLSFARLKLLAEGCGVLREVIETRKDQLEALEWVIRPKELARGQRPKEGAYQDKIKEITDFLKSPDKRLDWSQWLRELGEQHFVYDAACVYRRRDMSGKLYALEIVDGATIKPLMDQDGRTPMPPSPAYQQVLKGIPAADYSTFTTGDMLYYPQNARVDRLYGYPRTAQIEQYVNMFISRVRSQTAYFEEGNIPDGLLEGPASMTTAQIEAMQEHWDALFSGNIQQRRRAWWVPQGTKFTAIKKDPIVDEFDDWLARVVCYAFSISPQPFLKMMNRATAQSSQEVAEEEGLRPTMNFFKRLMNKVIEQDFGTTDVEFAWDEDVEFDPVKQANIHNIYARLGALSLDRIRDDIGEDPIGGMFSEPMFATPNGWVPVDPEERIEMTTPPATPGGPPQAPGQFGQKPNGPPGSQAKPGQSPVKKPGQPGATPPGGSKAPGDSPPGQQQGNQPVKKSYNSLYISRPLLNAHEIVKWAQGQGFTDVTSAEDMEVVLARSDNQVEVDDLYTASSMVYVDDGFRTLDALDGHVIILRFDSSELEGRWMELLGKGLPWTEENFEPYIVITRNGRVPENFDTVQKEVTREIEKTVPDPTDAKKTIQVKETFQEKVTEKVQRPLEVYKGPLYFGEEQISGVGFENGAFVKITAEEVDAAAAETESDPSPEQVAAGNYKKGHVTIQGLDITIENEAGSRRSGTSSDGNTWSVTMPTHYGYIKQTEGADGDHVDCYLGPNPESDRVFVVDQYDADTGEFDEHKCFIGYDNWSDAQADYMAAFSDGRAHERLGGVTSLSMDEFKDWLEDGDQTEPLHDDDDDDARMMSGTVGKAQHREEDTGHFSNEAGAANGKAKKHRDTANKHRETSEAHLEMGQQGQADAHKRLAAVHMRVAKKYDRAAMHLVLGDEKSAAASMDRGDEASKKANARSEGMRFKKPKPQPVMVEAEPILRSARY